ncbi:hypothetical protein J6590_081060 [Homalodisca vitripennis]|nr:hypothetical protein J6590_081060 [Homalodisca vitripennis]
MEAASGRNIVESGSSQRISVQESVSKNVQTSVVHKLEAEDCATRQALCCDMLQAVENENLVEHVLFSEDYGYTVCRYFSCLSTDFQFSVECERVVSPYIHRPRGLQAGGPMLLGVYRDSLLYLPTINLWVPIGFLIQYTVTIIANLSTFSVFVSNLPTHYKNNESSQVTVDEHKPHVVFSGRTQLCVTSVSVDLQALKVGKNSPSSVLHANDADLRTH